MRDEPSFEESATSRVSPRERVRWIERRSGARPRDFATSVLEGLSATPKRLECRWFYDALGSALFEQICETPEYYLTRAEGEILLTNAREIARETRPRTQLVELGSGSAEKTRLLIRALIAHQGRLTYVPIDISRSALEQSTLALVDELPGLDVVAVQAEYEAGLDELAHLPSGPKLVLWLGSNVGNFERAEATAFLRRLRAKLGRDDRLLIGIDLRKDANTLERAYDDAGGVTARFNLNLLARINRELGGQFDLERFAHRAHYNVVGGRVDMHLQALVAQRVRIAALERTFDFAKGELVHTESSFKYSLREIDALASESGWFVEGQWLDAAGRFALSRFGVAANE